MFTKRRRYSKPICLKSQLLVNRLCPHNLRGRVREYIGDVDSTSSLVQCPADEDIHARKIFGFRAIIELVKSVVLEVEKNILGASFRMRNRARQPGLAIHCDRRAPLRPQANQALEELLPLRGEIQRTKYQVRSDADDDLLHSEIPRTFRSDQYNCYRGTFL